MEERSQADTIVLGGKQETGRSTCLSQQDQPPGLTSHCLREAGNPSFGVPGPPVPDRVQWHPIFPGTLYRLSSKPWVTQCGAWALAFGTDGELVQ
jgi:hypothetical protein